MAEEKKEPLEQEAVKGQTECEAPDRDSAQGQTAADETAQDGKAQNVTESADGETEKEAAPADEAENGADAQTDQTADGEDSSDKKNGKGSWGFGFGKNKKDDKKDQQIAELTDKVKRQMAEFDNFRKRTEKEKSAMFEIGAKSVLEKLLPVVDNFERGLAAIPETERESATAVGMDKIYKQFIKALEELDVKPIEAVGQEFSPDFHNAVMQAEVEGVEENIIVEEFQKGYLYRGSVLRHSMVKVNK